MFLLVEDFAYKRFGFRIQNKKKQKENTKKRIFFSVGECSSIEKSITILSRYEMYRKSTKTRKKLFHQHEMKKVSGCGNKTEVKWLIWFFKDQIILSI